MPQICGSQWTPLLAKFQCVSPSAIAGFTFSIGTFVMSKGCSRPRSAQSGLRLTVGVTMSKPWPLVAFILLRMSSFEPMPVKLTLMPVFAVKP